MLNLELGIHLGWLDGIEDVNIWAGVQEESRQGWLCRMLDCWE
jgi:hypothetical protein